VILIPVINSKPTTLQENKYDEISAISPKSYNAKLGIRYDESAARNM
jgi:hypothetical protein